MHHILDGLSAFSRAPGRKQWTGPNLIKPKNKDAAKQKPLVVVCFCLLRASSGKLAAFYFRWCNWKTFSFNIKFSAASPQHNEETKEKPKKIPGLRLDMCVGLGVEGLRMCV